MMKFLKARKSQTGAPAKQEQFGAAALPQGHPPVQNTSGARCPFANLAQQDLMELKVTECGDHEHAPVQEPKITVPPKVNLIGRTHHTSPETAALLADIGGVDRLRQFCTRFYARMEEDEHLKQFLFATDGPAAHGKRLADWVAEKMGGGAPWTESGRLGMRQPSHHQAWYNDKRHPSVRGDHFQLDDCRNWMRLHFWAARECGLSEHAAFWRWYVGFIAHFISVYERRAPPYARIEAEWSADPKNIETYLADGRFMKDIVENDFRGQRW